MCTLNQGRMAIVFLSLIVFLPGCKDTERSGNNPPSVAPVFTTPIVSLNLSGDKVLQFGIRNCKVFKAAKTKRSMSDWALLFEPAPYLLPQQCVRERLAFDGEYIQIEIGTQAFGAGGCCTNYAAYRSRNGEHWEIRPATSIKQWQKLEDTQ